MDYGLLQRHGLTNIEYEEPAAEPWLSPIGDVGDAGIYNIPWSPKNYRLMFELNGAELDRLEFALRLLEEQDVKAAGEEGPHCGISCDVWDSACGEEEVCENTECWVTDDLPVWGGEGDLEEVNKAPMPTSYKYILRYR